MIKRIISVLECIFIPIALGLLALGGLSVGLAVGVLVVLFGYVGVGFYAICDIIEKFKSKSRIT